MAKRILLTCLLAGVLLTPAASATPVAEKGAAVEPFPIDTAHSLLDFTVRLAGFTRVRGTFDNYSGVIMYDPDDLTRSYVRVVIQTGSIHTGIDFRDKDLKSAKFFNVEKFPTMTFESVRIEKTGNGFRAVGPLTIRDVTKEVAIPFEVVSLESPDAWQNRRIAFSGAITINRRDYGINGPKFWNNAISETVKIELDISASIPNYERHQFNSREKPSIGEVVLKTVQENGITTARRKFTELRESNPEAYNFKPQELILAARRLAQAEKYDDAIGIMELLLDSYPELKNSKQGMVVVHQEMAKWHLRLGKKAEAIEHCEKALEINSEALIAATMLHYLTS